MRKGIFGLSKEELDANGVSDESTVTFEPEDVIAAEEDADELAELVADTQESATEIEIAETTQGAVEEEVVRQEELLEKPEEITTTDVIVAQEKLNFAARMLGVDLADLGISTVSRENLDKSPITSLEVSLENAKEMVMNIIENIKIVFKKIIVNIKKIYVKIVVMFNRIDDTAKGLLDKITGLKLADDAKFTPEQQYAIASRLAIPAALNGKKISDNPVTAFKEYLTGVSTNEYTGKYEKAATLLFKATDVVLESKGEKGVAEWNKAAVEFNDIQMSGLAKDVVGFIGTNGDAFTQKPADGAYGPFRFDGNAIKTVVTVVDKNKLGATIQETINATQQTVVTLKFKPDFLKSVTVDVPKKEALINVIKAVREAGGKVKAFSDKSMEAINASDKAIDKVAGIIGKTKEIGGASKAAVNFTTKNARILVTNVALDSILGYVGAVKAVLSYCSASASLYTK